MTFDYEIKKDKNVNIISLKGQLMEKNQALDLNQKIDELLEDNETKYILELSELKHLNSSGLNVLINILSKARKAGGETLITNVPKKINELLIITRLNTVFTVVDSLESAVAQLN